MTRLLRITILLNLWLGILRPGYAQVFALAQHSSQKTQLLQHTTRPLKDVLRDLQDHYNVDIVFFDRSVNGLLVPADMVDFKAPLQKNIANVLKPLGLRYKQTENGGYMVLEKTPEGRTEADSPRFPGSNPVAATQKI